MSLKRSRTSNNNNESSSVIEIMDDEENKPSSSSSSSSSSENEYETEFLDEEFEIWKNNVPYLYSICIRKPLTESGLTCQWLPTQLLNQNLLSYRTELIFGTEGATEETNYPLKLATFTKLPKDSTKNPLYEIDNEDSSLEISRNISLKRLNANRARFMPSDHFIVATRMGNSSIGIFKLDNLENEEDIDNDEGSKPFLIGHISEEEDESNKLYGLDWSLRSPGSLLTSGKEGCILWNVDRTSFNDTMVPIRRFIGNDISDCSWNPHIDDSFLTVSIQGKIGLHTYDLKSPKKTSEIILKEKLNSISFNPLREHQFITGGGNHHVILWDDRKLHADKQVHVFTGHVGEISALQWSPFHNDVFASASNDCRVALWDLNNIGISQTKIQAEDGVPELLFIHGGHRGKVMDVSWSSTEEWLLSSISLRNENQKGDIQIWKPSEHVYS